jgi:thioredoxin
MKQVLFLTFILAVMLPLTLYSQSKAPKEIKKEKRTSNVKSIESAEELKKVVDTAGDKLLVFDLYADWCMPCKILSPMLEDIAFENTGKASFYKVNIDKNQEVAAAFGVTGIPFVVFVKNQKGIHAITGLQQMETYQRAIDQYSGTDRAKEVDGELVEGTRVIKRNAAAAPGDIYVYRGDKVKLIIENIQFPYSIHIPRYNLSKEAKAHENLEVEFKAKDIGTFPIFCNGKCPSGDGSQIGKIIVMQYKSSDKAQFTELNAKQAKNLIKDEKPLIVDVRTPNEYYTGHLERSKLIPLQQLEARLSELKQYKDKKILLYCRSGNRSTVASQILINNGFKKLYNLRSGIKGWKKEGFKLKK